MLCLRGRRGRFLSSSLLLACGAKRMAIALTLKWIKTANVERANAITVYSLSRPEGKL